MRILMNAFAIILLKSGLLFAGGDGTCSSFIPKAIEISDTFTAAINAMQDDCIRTLNFYAVTQYYQPYTDFANALFEIYTQCAKSESDLFVEMYDKLHLVIDPGNEISGETVADYLSGIVDVSRYPFSCIASNLESAIDLVATYDKELSDSSNLYLKHHETPNEDPILP